MPDLIAQGQQRNDRWRRSLPDGKTITVGRAAGSWSVPWDDRISRQHAQLTVDRRELQVQALPAATNPIFHRGRAVESVRLQVGESFVIGGTTFTFSDERPQVAADLPVPVTEQTFSLDYLRRVEFRSARQRIEVLSQLPQLVRHAGTDDELFVHLTNVLLSGISKADAVALVQGEADSQEAAAILHWDRARPSGAPFQPSERLIREAWKRNESVLHVWKPGGSAEFTARADIDWAFCTPITGLPARRRAIYVAGSQQDPSHPERATDPFDLRDDLKFTELVASLVGSLQQVRFLQRRQASLSQFFSPLVVEALAEEDPERVLAAQEADIAVLFCDLRGFARTSERDADNIMGLLERVSQALGVLTHHILAEGGVVGDFHGDAAMGFWGWPLAQPDRVARACRAALAIRRELEQAAGQRGHPLAGFRVGMGIASGRAVAGKIGTEDQVKVTVFGPVVNLASRLEGMTKILRAPVLVDQATARQVRGHLSPAVARVRRVAIVRPAGLDRPVEVSELLPPVDQYPRLQDEHLARYEQGLDALLAGQWNEAVELLHQVPASDQVKDFLTVFIARHNRAAPPDWDGVIPLESK